VTQEQIVWYGHSSRDLDNDKGQILQLVEKDQQEEGECSI